MNNFIGITIKKSLLKEGSYDSYSSVLLNPFG